MLQIMRVMIHKYKYNKCKICWATDCECSSFSLRPLSLLFLYVQATYLWQRTINKQYSHNDNITTNQQNYQIIVSHGVDSVILY